MMKKWMALLLSLLLVFALASCGKTQTETPQEPDEQTQKPDAQTQEPAGLALTENGGLQECVDVETSPLEGCGVHTSVDTANGTVTFTKTDDKGQDSVEYLKFTPANNEVEKYYYVSMMGTGFYYYYDLTAGEMVRMEDKDHNDTTESAKGNGRFDGPAAEMKAEVEALEAYFEASFGKTIADAAAGN